MLPQANRLKKQSDIKTLLLKGKNFYTRLISVKYSISHKSQVPRFTVVVSTKAEKKAVLRNRLKRVVREFLKKNKKAILPGDYMIFLKKSSFLKEKQETLLLEDLKNFFNIYNN